jgi:hypothetical protein
MIAAARLYPPFWWVSLLELFILYHRFMGTETTSCVRIGMTH